MQNWGIMLQEPKLSPKYAAVLRVLHAASEAVREGRLGCGHTHICASFEGCPRRTAN